MTVEAPAATKLATYRPLEGGVSLIELNDPPANTYTHEMMRDLDEAILAARFDDDCHAVVLTGFGDKFFCAGANIKMLASVTPKFKYYFCLHANETLSRMEQTPKLFIAALNGHCVGGGLEIAMATDMIVARKGAGKIGLPEISLGVLPGTGGTQRLTRIVGKRKALELMIKGDNFSFETAKEYGIVNEIFDSEGFMDKVISFARSFCPLHRASKAVGNIKRCCQSGPEIPFENALTLERELQQQLFQSEDAKEGLSAFVEKRTPKFKGR